VQNANAKTSLNARSPNKSPKNKPFKVLKSKTVRIDSDLSKLTESPSIGTPCIDSPIRKSKSLNRDQKYSKMHTSVELR